MEKVEPTERARRPRDHQVDIRRPGDVSDDRERLSTCCHDLGYDLIVSPLTGLFAATKAMIDAYGTLKDHGTLRDHLDLVVTFDDFGRVIDLDRHYELEQRYAGDAP